jgi:hypothetical protein
MIVKHISTLLEWKPKHIKIPLLGYSVGYRVLGYHFMKKGSFKIFIGKTIDGDKTLCEIVNFVTDMEFYMELPIRRSQNIHRIFA